MTPQVNLIDSYQLYVKTNKSESVDRKTYLTIVYGLMKFIIAKVFDGYTVRLGDRLGIVGVKGKLAKPVVVDHPDGTQTITGLAPNWAETGKIYTEAAEKLGMTLHEYTDKVPIKERPMMAYCFNEHSNGIAYHLNWYKDNVIVVNKSFYTLKFSFDNKRAFSKGVQEGKEYDVDENKSTIKNFNPNTNTWTKQN